MANYQVGDHIQFKHSSIIKEIVAVRDTGYSWKYPKADQIFHTDNDIDKFLEDGYHRYEKS